MSLESDLFNTLKVICPRVYPDIAPANTARPYITWQQFGGNVINPLANELPDKRNAFIQISIWADTRLAANALAMQIESALVQSNLFTARPQAALMALPFEEETGLYGCSQDFSIWALR